MITDGTKLLVLLAGSVLTAAGVAGLAIAIGHGHLQTALSFGLVAIVGVAAIVYGGWLPLAQTAPSPAAPGARTAYPLVLEGQLDSPLSRWRWLLKWLLALPHLFVLALLMIAFTVLTIAAFFAILVSGRYPRPVFETNVGILRWGWRVGFYAYGVLGTDRYPPFSLQPADYPAGLTIRYPEHWSRGLALVKWWLLAVPHYVIVGLFSSSGAAGSGSSGAPDHPRDGTPAAGCCRSSSCSRACGCCSLAVTPRASSIWSWGSIGGSIASSAMPA